MNTKIYSANIIIGRDEECPVMMEQQPIKRLPIPIHCANEDFIRRIIKHIGEKVWLSYKIDRHTQLPRIRIEYLKYLGNCLNEPTNHEYGC